VCRLLAYAATKENKSLKEILTPTQVEGYLWMSTIHNDGWGAAHMVDASDSAHIEDGGAPSRDTTTSIYKSTESAFLDPMVEAVTDQQARSAIFHLRLATPGIPLEIDNQQPFSCDGITFSHNGSIEDDKGSILDLPVEEWPVTYEEFERTGGRSDSALLFALIIRKYGEDGNLVKAMIDAIAWFRTKYPEATFNCALQTEDALIFTHAASEGPLSEELGKIYTEKGFANHIADYRDIKYRELPGEGIVIASTGFSQREKDGWKELPNNALIAVDTHTGKYETVAIPH
jgi:predicted glutamine amidotransferase